MSENTEGNVAQVVGLDLSLTGTGVCLYSSGTIESYTIDTQKRLGMDRIDYIVSKCLDAASSCDVIVMEDLALQSRNGKAMERAGLAYVLRWRLWKVGKPFILVAPGALKKFVAGKGNAEKDKMILEVYKRFGIEAADNNQADAIGLAYIGAAYLGAWAMTTEAQRQVMKKLCPSSDVATSSPQRTDGPSSLAA